MEKYIHRENLALLKKPRGSVRRVRAQNALEVVGGGSERHVGAEVNVMNRKGVDFTLVKSSLARGNGASKSEKPSPPARPRLISWVWLPTEFSS